MLCGLFSNTEQKRRTYAGMFSFFVSNSLNINALPPPYAGLGIFPYSCNFLRFRTNFYSPVVGVCVGRGRGFLTCFFSKKW